MTNKQQAPTSDEIWGILKETAEQMKETDRRLKKLDNLFTTQWRRLMESLVEGDLVKHLKEYGIKVERTSANEKGLMSYVDEWGNKQKEHCEIDIIAKNGKEIVVVEVKTTLRVKDVSKFLTFLKRLEQLLPEYKGKKIYGAVAYLRSQDSSEIYSEKQGLFVIRATGNISNIINQRDFKPISFSGTS